MLEEGRVQKGKLTARIVSPTLPPEERYVTCVTRVGWGFFLRLCLMGSEGGGSPFRSVDTPVAKRPLEATAKEPPMSAVRVMDVSEM